MLYPEMRKISAQEEEDEAEFVEESSGTPGELVRSKSAGKLMTQIPLTILPCSSSVSLCASPFIAFPFFLVEHSALCDSCTPGPCVHVLKLHAAYFCGNLCLPRSFLITPLSPMRRLWVGPLWP